MKRELELYLQLCSNLTTIVERAKHEMFKLQPHQLTHRELGLFGDVMCGLSNIQTEIQAAAFDARHGEPKGEA